MKPEITAHLAEARDTTFVAMERAEDWNRIEARFAAERIGRELHPIDLGRLIAAVIEKEDRGQQAESRQILSVVHQLTRDQQGDSPVRHNVVPFDPSRRRRP